MNQTNRLEKLEETIEQFQQYRLKAGKALWEIDEKDLYEERGYHNVEEYAASHFGLKPRRAKQLICFARVVEVLEDKGSGTPSNEAQARSLVPLLDDQEDELVEVWELAVDRHGVDGVTMNKVREAKYDHLQSAEDDADDEADYEDEPESLHTSLTLPAPTADRLGLSGDLRRGRRVVPADGIDRPTLHEVIEETEPSTSPLDGGADGELGSAVWRPLRGETMTKRLQTEPPSSLSFHPDKVQRIRESHVPDDNNTDDFRDTEDSDALACPAFDILSDNVPDVFTEEILKWGGGGDWNPIFLSSHAGRWTDYSLPDEGWIGARSDRSSIEETAEALDEADDSEVKWTLYDLGGDDRREGLPDVDLSVLDWVVIDEISENSELPFTQIRTIRESLPDHTTLRVRGEFTTYLKDKPA